MARAGAAELSSGDIAHRPAVRGADGSTERCVLLIMIRVMMMMIIVQNPHLVGANGSTERCVYRERERERDGYLHTHSLSHTQM